MAFALWFIMGMVLGQRFKVLILMPAIALATLVAVATGIGRTEPFWSVLLAAALSVTGLQIGYLAGTGVRLLIAATRASRRRQAPLEQPLQARGPAH